MRWSQGVWSEHRLIEAVNETGKFIAIPYGSSGTAPTNNVKEFELYFERLEAAGLGKIKRPDLLIFRQEQMDKVKALISTVGGLTELPFIPESDAKITSILKYAIIAVECENSFWRGQEMPDFKTPLRSQKRLGGKPGLQQGAVLPMIIIKEEDRKPLLEWQKLHRVPIHIWHAFYDRAYGLSLERAEELIVENLTETTVQDFKRPAVRRPRKPSTNIIITTVIRSVTALKTQSAACVCRGQQFCPSLVQPSPFRREI